MRDDPLDARLEPPEPGVFLLSELMLRIATWNINSVRLRADQVVRFIEEQQPDVLMLQEI